MSFEEVEKGHPLNHEIRAWVILVLTEAQRRASEERERTGLIEVRASVKWEKIDKILLPCFNGNEMHSFFNKKSYI